MSVSVRRRRAGEAKTPPARLHSPSIHSSHLLLPGPPPLPSHHPSGTAAPTGPRRRRTCRAPVSRPVGRTGQRPGASQPGGRRPQPQPRPGGSWPRPTGGPTVRPGRRPQRSGVAGPWTPAPRPPHSRPPSGRPASPRPPPRRPRACQGPTPSSERPRSAGRPPHSRRPRARPGLRHPWRAGRPSIRRPSRTSHPPGRPPPPATVRLGTRRFSFVFLFEGRWGRCVCGWGGMSEDWCVCVAGRGCACACVSRCWYAYRAVRVDAGGGVHDGEAMVRKRLKRRERGAPHA